MRFYTHVLRVITKLLVGGVCNFLSFYRFSGVQRGPRSRRKGSENPGTSETGKHEKKTHSYQFSMALPL